MNTRHYYQPLRTTLLGLLIALVAGCGASGDTTVANGGIGGTGITSGTVNGFGSIILNASIHETDNSTLFVRNGIASTQDAFRVGDVVRIEWQSNDNGLTRNALHVVYQRAIYGEVTGAPNRTTGKVEVVGQIVTANATTLFDNFTTPATAGEVFPLDLNVGACVEISGLADASGNLLATRIERVSSPCAAQAEIQGVVSALSTQPTQFTVNGTTTVSVPGGITIDPTPVALTENAFVRIQGSYSNGVLTAAGIQVRSDDYSELDDEDADIEGLISHLSISGSTAEFRVAGIPVSTTASTMFEKGGFNKLGNNVRVEVEGVFVDGVLVAEEIEFKLDGQVKIESILLGADADSGRFTLNFGPGVVVVVTTDPLLTRFKNDTDTPGRVLANLGVGDYVKITGYVDPTLSNTEPVAAFVELKQIAGADNEEISNRLLRGPVMDVSPDSFSVLGVRISTSGLTACNNALNETVVCGGLGGLVASLKLGDLVEVEGENASEGGGIIWDKLGLEND